MTSLSLHQQHSVKFPSPTCFHPLTITSLVKCPTFSRKTSDALGVDRDATCSTSAFKKFEKTQNSLTARNLGVSPHTLDFSKSPLILTSPLQLPTMTSQQSPTLSAFYNNCLTNQALNSNSAIVGGGSHQNAQSNL